MGNLRELKSIEKKIELLNCPSCNHSNIKIISCEYLKCHNCNEEFRVLSKNSAVMLLNSELSDSKHDIQKFWGDI